MRPTHGGGGVIANNMLAVDKNPIHSYKRLFRQEASLLRRQAASRRVIPGVLTFLILLDRVL
jgi:hypothetical protein